MKPLKEILHSPLVSKIVATGDDGAMFDFRYKSREYEVIVSFGGGWDHVSIVPVHHKRIPTWEVMCVLKDMWKDSNDRNEDDDLLEAMKRGAQEDEN